MKKVGIRDNKGNKKYTRKISPRGRKLGIRINTAILLVLAVCTLAMAAMPASAIVAVDADTPPAASPSASCPCNGQCPPTTPAAQSPAADVNALNQPVQSSNSPGNTAQQSTVYTPQYTTTTVPVNAANVNTATPAGVQNNAGTNQTNGTASTADFDNLFSRWVNNQVGNNVPGYDLRNPTNQMFGISPMYSTSNPLTGAYPIYTTNGRTVGIAPLFTGWQTTPIDTVQRPMQANWLDGLTWL